MIFNLYYGWPSVRWGEITKEDLETDDVKMYWEKMIIMREGMEANHKNMMIEAVERARDEILNNGSGGGTDDDVPYHLMPSPMSKSFDEKKNKIRVIECEDKDMEKENIRRAMIEAVTESFGGEFCATLQPRSEATRKK